MRLPPLLALRPVNAARQLGPGSRVPLLGLRQSLPVLTGWKRPLWLAVVRGRSEAEAVLRAAARRQAVVGLCLWPGECPPFELRYRFSPAAFFQAVRQAAEAVEGCGPFVLHAQLPSPEPASREALLAFSTACIEAGFTSLGVCLDLASDPQGVEAVLGVLAPAFEFELGTMLLARPAAAAGAWMKQLAASSFEPEVLLGEKEIPQRAGEIARGWGSRDFCPPTDLRTEVILGPLERGNSPEASEALAYSETLRYLEAYSLQGSAERLEQIFSAT